VVELTNVPNFCILVFKYVKVAGSIVPPPPPPPPPLVGVSGNEVADFFLPEETNSDTPLTVSIPI